MGSFFSKFSGLFSTAPATTLDDADKILHTAHENIYRTIVATDKKIRSIVAEVEKSEEPESITIKMLKRTAISQTRYLQNLTQLLDELNKHQMNIQFAKCQSETIGAITAGQKSLKDYTGKTAIEEIEKIFTRAEDAIAHINDISAVITTSDTAIQSGRSVTSFNNNIDMEYDKLFGLKHTSETGKSEPPKTLTGHRFNPLETPSSETTLSKDDVEISSSTSTIADNKTSVGITSDTTSHQIKELEKH